MFEGRYAMDLNFEVDIPKIPGKINYVKKGGTVYVRYVLERVYHTEKNIMFRSRGSLEKDQKITRIECSQMKLL